MTSSPLNGPRRPRLAICGFGHGAEDAPWDDPNVTIWGCNSWPFDATDPLDRTLFADQAGRVRADQWWQIHPITTWNDAERAWFDHLPETQIPTVVLVDQVPSIIRAYPDVDPAWLVDYDAAVWRARYPHGLFASTFCLQLAAAIYEDHPSITLYGAECRHIGRELVVERPAATYWQGVAHAQGIACTFSPPSTLGHHPYIYGASYAAECRYAAEVTSRVLGDLIQAGHNLDSVADVEAFLKDRPELTPSE